METDSRVNLDFGVRVCVWTGSAWGALGAGWPAGNSLAS